MKSYIVLVSLIIIVSGILVGCNSSFEKPNQPKAIYSGDIFPPENYKISNEDENSIRLLKELGLNDDNVIMIIYNLKRANCGTVTKIEMDSSNNYYNIHDNNNKLFKLYSTNGHLDALFDENDNSIFAFIK